MPTPVSWTQLFAFAERKECPFCQGTQFKPLVAYEGLHVVRCACGYVFMNPYLTEEGSRRIFSEDVSRIFPWLKNYSLEEHSADALILKSYRNALDFFENHFPRR